MVPRARPAQADVDAQDDSGNTALIAASDNGESERVRVLLAEGAKTYLQDAVLSQSPTLTCLGHEWLFTSLPACAVWQHSTDDGGHLDIVRMLLEAEADPDIVSKVFVCWLSTSQSAPVASHSISMPS